jgi:hypothetical protein
MRDSAIDALTRLPQAERPAVRDLVQRLAGASGVLALVLGGSYASGRAGPASDVDLALLYAEANPPDLTLVRAAARAVSQDGAPTVTGLYDWGPWVNGGAWIRTPAGKVDLLYRNVDQIRRTVAEARRGIVQRDYDQQPAFGFSSVIYLAEAAASVALHDPTGVVAALAAAVAEYPPALRAAVVKGSLASAEFTLANAPAFARRGDVLGTVGCLCRAAAALVQALFAMNRTYFPGDKAVGALLPTFACAPKGFLTSVGEILARPGSSPTDLDGAVQAMRELWGRVVPLADPPYAPRFGV